MRQEHVQKGASGTVDPDAGSAQEAFVNADLPHRTPHDPERLPDLVDGLFGRLRCGLFQSGTSYLWHIIILADCRACANHAF